MKTKKLSTILVALFFGLITTYSAQAQTFTTIATDVAGDGNSNNLLDGTLLEYYYDAMTDSIQFRVTVANLSTNQQAVGINVMVNIPNGGQTFTFWGFDNSNPYHRLITTWVTGSPGNYSGTIGIADNAGVSASNYTNLSSNNIAISLGGINQVILTVKRSDLIPDSYFGMGNTITCVTAAAVGSNAAWNDDIYSSSGTMTITKNFAANTKSIASNNLWSLDIYPNPATDKVVVSLKENFKNADISVFNQFGQLVKRINNISGQNYSLETSSLSAGFYFIKATQEEKSFSSQFVVNK